MTENFIFPGPAPLYQELAYPARIIDSLQQPEARVATEEAETVLRWVVYETRRALLKSLRYEFQISACDRRHLPELEHHLLGGLCGISQCVAAYALQDVNLPVKAFAVQSLQDAWQGHVALTLTLPTVEGEKLYLIDPTFRQFCDPERTDWQGIPYPGFALAWRSGGPEFLNALLRNGYVEPQPAMALLYLNSFCTNSYNFNTPQDAITFLKNPPENNYNYYLSRNDLKRRGYLITPSV